MKKRNMIRLAALCLCLVLLVGCSGQQSMEQFWNGMFGWLQNDEKPAENGRRLIPYDEMEYERPDVEAMLARIAELTETIKNAGSFEELMEADDEAGELSEQFQTMQSLAMLRTYQDRTDSYYEEENRYCSDAGVSLSNTFNELNRAILEGPYAEDYRQEIGDYLYRSIETSLRLNSPEVEALKQRRNQLNVDYNNMIAEMAFDKAGHMRYMEGLSGKNQPLWYTSSAAADYADIYIEMINLDKEIAGKLGFASAAEMYYLEYSRDYTPEDAMQFAQNSKKYFAPLWSSVAMMETYTDEISLEDTMKALPEMMQRVDPELETAWKDMTYYGLYDYEGRKNKQSGVGFTTSLPLYDAPFCFSSWSDDLNSAMTVIHEFGHFYSFWLDYEEPTDLNLDIAEIYSQSLELLMHEQLGDITDDAQQARQAHLANFMNPLVYQIALEEFQFRIYEEESLDNEKIASIYGAVLAEYGLGNGGKDYTWFFTTHLFDAPFYTVSYWTSALVSLQIWVLAQDDWDAAAQTYREMIHGNQNQPFTSLVEEAGLRGPTDEQVLRDIAERYMEAFSIAGIDLPEAA